MSNSRFERIAIFYAPNVTSAPAHFTDASVDIRLVRPDREETVMVVPDQLSVMVQGIP
jgi:hypothetical protein